MARSLSASATFVHHVPRQAPAPNGTPLCNVHPLPARSPASCFVIALRQERTRLTIWSYLSVGKWICEVPAHAKQDDLRLIMPPLKGVGLGHGNEGLPVAVSQLSTRRLRFCNTTIFITLP
jgi:hypothetical protein